MNFMHAHGCTSLNEIDGKGLFEGPIQHRRYPGVPDFVFGLTHGRACDSSHAARIGRQIL